MEEVGASGRRGRKRKFKNSKEGSRIRSQRYRENKQNYITLLENEIRELKQQVTDLSLQVDYYKNLIKVKNIDPDKDSDNFKFLREEQFLFNELVNVIQNMPMMIKQVTHFQNWENSGLMTESRIKFIKNSIKSLIDFCIPVGVKLSWEILKSMDKNTLDKIEEYQATSNLLKPAFIKEHNISEFDEIIYNYEGSLEVMEFIKMNYEKWTYTYVNLKDWVNQLVKIQHRIIGILKKGDEEFKNNFFTTKWSLYNHLIILLKHLNNPKFVKRYSLWDIPQKQCESKEESDMNYISEDEAETISVTIKTV